MTANSLTVDEGETRLLSIVVHSYPEQPKLTWFKDGQPFTTASDDGR